jgi:hypothetical protein
MECRRYGTDRRHKAGDRRIGLSIDYFLKAGVERRSWKERRSGIDRRQPLSEEQGIASQPVSPDSSFISPLVDKEWRGSWT